jgi:tetratricopeptide (TPR) repeat protein
VLIEGMLPGESVTFEQLVERSEKIARDTGANDLRARIFAADFLASWYGANGGYARAEELLTRTLDSLPEEPQTLGSGLRCMRAGLWAAMGRSEEALATLNTEITRGDLDDAVLSQCLLIRSRMAANTGDGATALDFARQSLVKLESSGVASVYNRAAIAQAIGGAHGLLDQFDQAHAQYREALRLLNAYGRARSRAASAVHDDWASLWMNAGNPRRALEELDTSWEIIAETTPNASRVNRVLYRRGRIYSQLARPEEALADFRAVRESPGLKNILTTQAGVTIGEAEVAVFQGELDEAERLLSETAEMLRQARIKPGHVLYSRERMTRASLLAAQGRTAEARAELTRAIDNYEAQHCCHAHVALALAHRAELALDTADLESAESDARRAVELAPSRDGESFSRFTGSAWLATGRLREAQGRAREARDAYAVAAVQFAGSQGEAHPDTRRAREAISRMAAALSTKNYN